MEDILELEDTIIACIINKNELINELFISEEIFTNPYNAKMLKFYKKIYSKEKTLDSKIVLSYFKNEDQQSRYIDYFLEHNVLRPNYGMFYNYQERLQEVYVDKKITGLADLLIKGKISTEDFVLKVKDLEKEKLTVDNNHKKKTPEEMLNIIRTKNKLIEFNRLTFFNTQTKFKRKTINVIAARPSEGKSALALNMFTDLSKTYKCLYFNLEMTEAEVYERMIGIESGIPIKHINTPETEYQDSKIKEYATKLYSSNYEVVNGSKNVKGAISKIIKEQRDEHLIVFIDYIGYLSNKPGQSDKDRIGEITRMLNDITKDYDCTIFLVAQINRQGSDKPTMEDLKDSGELEQSADTIVLIHDESKENTSSTKEIKLLIPKCRSSKRNVFIKIKYFKESQRMEGINE